MRQSVIILFVMLILNISASYSLGAVKGGVEYTIPIDYEKINEADFAQKAEGYYDKVMYKSLDSTEDDMSQALILYSALHKKCPWNIDYSIRLGNLYMKQGKYRYAKGCFYEAMGINANRPEPYYYLGDLYFKREQYRRALKMYKRASDNGYADNIDNINKINKVKRMLGEK